MFKLSGTFLGNTSKTKDGKTYLGFQVLINGQTKSIVNVSSKTLQNFEVGKPVEVPVSVGAYAGASGPYLRVNLIEQ